MLDKDRVDGSCIKPDNPPSILNVWKIENQDFNKATAIMISLRSISLILLASIGVLDDVAGQVITQDSHFFGDSPLVPPCKDFS